MIRVKFQKENNDIQITVVGDQRVFLRPKRSMTMVMIHNFMKNLRKMSKTDNAIIIPANIDVLIVSRNGDVTKI